MEGVVAVGMEAGQVQEESTHAAFLVLHYARSGGGGFGGF